MPKTKEESLMDSVDFVDESSVITPDENTPKRVVPGDPEWSDFVLSHLVDGEFITNDKGKRLPFTDVLPRLVTKLLGPIVESDSYYKETTNEGNVVVEHKIVILSNGMYQIPEGVLSIFTGLADANVKNVDHPYSRYLPQNASTRAKGRALRDSLMLRVCVAEELSKVAEEPDTNEFDRLTSTQKAGIESSCKRMKIDVEKLIRFGEFKFKNIDDVTKGKATAMLGILNGYQQGKEIPEYILL